MAKTSWLQCSTSASRSIIKSTCSQDAARKNYQMDINLSNFNTLHGNQLHLVLIQNHPLTLCRRPPKEKNPKNQSASSHSEAVEEEELSHKFFAHKWVAMMTKAQENLIQMTKMNTKTWDKISKAQWKRKFRLSIRKSRPNRLRSSQANKRLRKVPKAIGVSETLRKHQPYHLLRILLSRLFSSSNYHMDTTLQVLKKRKWASMRRDVPTKEPRKKQLNKMMRKKRRRHSIQSPKVSKGRTRQRDQGVGDLDRILQEGQRSQKLKVKTSDLLPMILVATRL